MKFEIPLAIIQETTHCTKQFACLTGAGCLQHINYASLRGKIIFIDCNTNAPCAYRQIVGGNFYCNCPTRRAIYDKYHI